MKKTRKELGDLYQALLSVGNLTGVKFSYAVARNLATLKSEMESLKKSVAMTDKFDEYEVKRVTLAEKYSVKEDGKPKIVDNKYEIQDQKSFDKDLKELQIEYKEHIDNRANQLKELEELLKEEVEVSLFMITQDMIPEAITSKQMADIMPIIKE